MADRGTKQNLCSLDSAALTERLGFVQDILFAVTDIPPFKRSIGFFWGATLSLTLEAEYAIHHVLMSLGRCNVRVNVLCG